MAVFSLIFWRARVSPKYSTNSDPMNTTGVSDVSAINSVSLILLWSWLYTCENSIFRLYKNLNVTNSIIALESCYGLKKGLFCYSFFWTNRVSPKDPTNSDPIDTTGFVDFPSINSYSIILVGSLIYTCKRSSF